MRNHSYLNASITFSNTQEKGKLHRMINLGKDINRVVFTSCGAQIIESKVLHVVSTLHKAITALLKSLLVSLIVTAYGES